VIPLSGDQPFPDAVQRVRLRSPRLGECVFALIAVRSVHEALLIKIEGIDDRDQASELAGASLEVEAGVLPPPGDDEMYVYELEGASVCDEQGVHLGTVRRLLDNGGQDLLDIESAEGERLLPLVDETLVRFDRTTRTLVVRPIPGLWE
jgi:16S rRNA processing protein RimM